MASTNLEMSIKTLREYINRMMDKCERAVELSVNSMINKDIDLAKRVIDDDDDIDILRSRRSRFPCRRQYCPLPYR